MCYYLLNLIQEPSFRDPFVDVLDRDRDPRMGWHDIHMSVGTSICQATRKC